MGDYVILLLEQHMSRVHILTPMHVALLEKVMRSAKWPIVLYEELYARLCELIVKDDFTPEGISRMGLLSNLLSLKSTALPLHKLKQTLHQYLDKEDLEWNIEPLFRVIRNVGLSDPNLLRLMFAKVFEIIKDDPHEFKFFIGKYRRTQSALHGFFRDRELEKEIEDILDRNIRECFETRNFCVYFSYLLPLRNISAEILDKFYEFLPQMNAFDIMMISDGLRQSVQHQYRAKTPLKNRYKQGENYQVLDEIALALHRQAQHLLTKPGVDIMDICFILRSLEAGVVACDENFNKLLNDAFSNVKDQLNLMTVNELSRCLLSCAKQNEFPEILDSILTYFDESPLTKETSTGTLQYALDICFQYNKTPSANFLQMYAQNLYREMDGFDGIQVLSKMEYLAIFQALPKYLAKAVFSSEFMDQLDNEIKDISDNSNRISLTRRRLMRLNRCLVLQYPDYKVPWFHQQYCEQNPPAFSKVAGAFKDEVYKELCTALGNWRYVRLDSYSKYYNQVFIELNLDAQGNLIDLYTDNQTAPARRIALQTYDESSYTRNTKKLRGDGVHNNQQLSLQGWEVVTISPFRWNSMYLANSDTRQHYLQETVQAIRASNLSEFSR